MPAQIQFFDMEASASPLGWLAPIPVTLGPNWQPNDIRVFCNLWFLAYQDYNTDLYIGNQGIVPVGFTGIVPNTTFAGNVRATYSDGPVPTTTPYTQPGYGVISWRRLIPGDVDTFIQPTEAQWLAPSAASCYATATFTIRGVNPTSTPSIGGLSWTNSPWNFSTSSGSADGGVVTFTQTTGVMSNQAASVTVPAAGTMVYWLSTGGAPAIASYQSPSPTGCSMGIPTGWTPLVATANSGSTYYPYDMNDACQVVAKSFGGSGSTGTVTVPVSSAVNKSVGLLYPFYYNATTNVQGARIFVVPAPDVSATTGSASTVNTATTATFSSSTLSANATGNAFTTNIATTSFNSTQGYWISDPVVLSGAPVTGSMVRWSAITPPSTTLTVQTSLNNGASWDLATNNQSIPRLEEGDTTTQSVLAKVTLTRAFAPSLFPGPTVFLGSQLFLNGSPPKLTSFEIDASTDASVDELVPIGFGMIDKVTVHATSGTTGSGSSTNVAGSTGVIGKGGGQTGGGTAILVHVNDMSYAIKRNVWQMPYTVPSGENYGDAIQAMVLNRLPSQTAFNIVSTTLTCPPLLYGAQQGGDPWQDIQELAQAIGYEAFFDPVGTFVCRPVPNPQTGEPVWVFDDSAIQVISEAELELSSEQTFNDIVVVGQSTASSNPFSAEAYDDNPASPTYVLGPYGRVTQRLIFSLINSQEQAQTTANVALFNSLGAAHSVTLTVVPMPALEPGDIVRVNCSNVNANGTYMINSMTTPLSPADPQQLVCFKQSTGS